MSNLQLSLTVIGGIVLALIVAYNTWTTRRNTPKRSVPTTKLDDAEYTETGAASGWHATRPQWSVTDEPPPPARDRQDPVLDGDTLANMGYIRGSEAALAEAVPNPVHTPDSTPATSAHEAADHAATVAAMDEADAASSGTPDRHCIDATDAIRLPAPAAHAPNDRRAVLAPLMDVIAAIQPEHPVMGEAVIAVLPPTRRAGSKPFTIEAFNAATSLWELPAPGQQYVSFQAGVQLANRTGALNDIEFSEFVVKVQAFADALNASADFPDMLHEVARARELDHFAGEHDAQLNFMIRARKAAWSVGYLLQNAARVGLLHSALPGRLVLPSKHMGMPALVTISYDSQAALADDLESTIIRDITLSLDVPQVSRAEQPLARLRTVAAVLCNVMDGVLCDQTGQPIVDEALDPIAIELEHLYNRLEEREVPAGSALARRLFS